MNRETRIKPDSRLSGEQAAEILQLLDKSSSVELKVTVAEEHHGVAIKGLGFDPVEAEPRQTFFFDTPALDLNRAGLVVRARRKAGGKGDTVIKLRPVNPSSLDRSSFRDPSFKVEIDAMPGGYVCSASYKGACSAAEISEVVQGEARLPTLFSKKQREFYKDHAPAQLSLDELVPLGPTFLLRVKHSAKSFDRPITIELWLYPDGSRLLEISTKGEPKEAFHVAAQFRAFLTTCGIDVEQHVGTKTGAALKFFSKQLIAKSALH